MALLDDLGQIPFMLLLGMGGFGPTAAAYIYILRSKNSKGDLKEFHSRVFKWRVGFRWYVVALALAFGLEILSVGIASLINEEFFASLTLASWFQVVPIFFFSIFAGGLEELGWRGVALPELQKRLHPIISSLVLGAIWSLWHLPFFFVSRFAYSVTNILPDYCLFSLAIIGVSLILTWIYNGTNSIFLCVIYHAAFNTVGRMGFRVSLSSEPVGTMIDVAIKLFVGLVLLIGLPILLSKHESFRKS